MHSLIIGGTGMLAAASEQIAERSAVTTMVARSDRSLERFQRRCGHDRLHRVRADWSDEPRFLELLSAHVRDVGAPDLVLAWLHRTAFGPAVARVVCAQASAGLFVQVCGSLTPRRSEPVPEPGLGPPTGVEYRRVILGFVEEAGARRWLTHDEI